MAANAIAPGVTLFMPQRIPFVGFFLMALPSLKLAELNKVTVSI